MDALYTLADLERDLARLQARYADVIACREIGRSVEGRPLYAVRLGEGTRCVLLNASHHAREWATTWLAMALLWRYAHAYATDARWEGVPVRALLDRVALVVVPVVNPDGVELATRGPAAVGVPEAQLRTMLRRNGWDRFALWKANVRGVDLNRQYDAGWSSLRQVVDGPAAAFYPGVRPATEPEVRAMIALTRTLRPCATLAYHTAGEEIYWYFGQIGERLHRDQALAEGLARLTGYRLIPEDDRTAYGGGYTDWVIATFCIPAFTLEVGREPHPVDRRQFARIWRQNKEVPFYLMREVVRLGMGED
ncbi:hypothetical protein JCM14720_01030 [Calditerricola yamamurae]